jgi:hypothetical protein
MGVAFVGKGLGVVAAAPSPASVVTPKILAASFRLLVATGYYLVTEAGDSLRTQTDG